MRDDITGLALEDLEHQTVALGRNILARRPIAGPMIWSQRWWNRRIMAWAMDNPQIRLQMLRFVDTLPMLTDDQSVVEHLQEHLHAEGMHLPRAIRAALATAMASAPTRRLLARTVRREVIGLANQFIAGRQVPDILRATWEQRQLQRGFTLDLLGEAVTSEFEADRYGQSYGDLIAAVAEPINRWPDISQVDDDSHGRIPRMNLSIKLSALDSQFDPIDPSGTSRRVADRLRPLLRVAQRHRVHIHVDMESYATKDLTLQIFRKVFMEDEFRTMADVGIVVQCYLRDSESDLRQLWEWVQTRGTPIVIRLVKGAYWDHETASAARMGWPVPVFTEKWQSDENFERQARFVLVHHDALRPAIGSHNLRSIAHALATAAMLGLPKNALEVQMLYGMADAEKQSLVELGYRLRVYMPFGDLIPGMGYLVRRLLENTSNISFLRTTRVSSQLPEKILMNPRNVSSPGAVPLTVSPQLTFHNEPHTDFSRADQRDAMHEALMNARKQFGRRYPLVIDGQSVSSEAWQTTHNPSRVLEVVGSSAVAELHHVSLAVAAARQALPGWSATAVESRAAILRGVAGTMRRRRFELAAWQVFECGKGWREADADVCEAIDFCEFYAQSAMEMARPRVVDVPGEHNTNIYVPRGVAAVIAPWNFPLAILTGMTAAALATGNTVVMKPAEQASIIGSFLMDIFVDQGLPAGVLNFLPGPGESVGTALVAHPDVALIAFTGSRSVGLEIHRRAAEISAAGGGDCVKRVIAEMGGKNAIVVDEDADLDEAIIGVMTSAFAYQGQKCSACSRCIVLNRVYEPFLERLVEATRSLTVGPAEDPASRIGPLINAESVVRVRRFIDQAKRDARQVLAVDVGKLAELGHYVGPHIFADVPPTCQLAQEEVFGPVLAVMRARDLDEALAVANGTQYALTAGFYSRSPARLERARRELLVGNLYLNRGITGALVNRQPFGGFKLSGIGSQAGGPDYLLQFVLPRTITENTSRHGFAPPPG